MSEIFVFGSNREGRHGRGAALEAVQRHGAVYGQARGLQGSSYAIITKELRHNKFPVRLAEVAEGVDEFVEFVKENPQHTYYLTRVGCGLAGFKDREIAPLFSKLWGLENITWPMQWLQFLQGSDCSAASNPRRTPGSLTRVQAV